MRQGRNHECRVDMQTSQSGSWRYCTRQEAVAWDQTLLPGTLGLRGHTSLQMGNVEPRRSLTFGFVFLELVIDTYKSRDIK